MVINPTDETYLNLCNKILELGISKTDRTGTGTISYCGLSARYSNIKDFFPLLTTKKVHFKSVVGELLWFLSGSTNAKELEEKYGCTIWREWAQENGDLGPVYGHQWRNFNSQKKDQILFVINELQHNPLSRRLIVSAWNPAQLYEMALPPCHYSYQFVAEPMASDSKINNYKLNIIFNQRSADFLLGVPFNISSYALLLMMICKEASDEINNFIPGDVIHNIGDAHIYSNHIEYIREQRVRTHYAPTCKVTLNKDKSIFDYTLEDIILTDYIAHPNWKNIPVAI
ncbi:MAG: thymidylate synthase [Clostridia bacterium]